MNEEITDEWIEEEITRAAQYWARWGRRFKWNSVNDKEDLLQIAWVACLRFADSIRACETKEHAKAYINGVVKWQIIKEEGFKENKKRRVRTVAFPTITHSEGDETSSENLVPSKSKDPSDIIDDREKRRRLYEYADEYAKDKCDVTREAVKYLFKGGNASELARRLGVSSTNVLQAQRRFVEYAKEKATRADLL